MALVMKADSVTGDSNISKHEGWIDVESKSAGSNSYVTIQGGGMSADVPNLSEIVISTVSGKHSPDFLSKHWSGKHFAKVEFEDLIISGDKDPVLSEKTTLEEVYVTSYSNSGHSGSGSRGSEQISLAFGTIEVEWFTQDKAGAVKSVGSRKYDNKAKKLLK